VTAIYKGYFLPGIESSIVNLILFVEHLSSKAPIKGSLVVAAVTSNGDSEIYLLGSQEITILGKFTGGKVTKSIQAIFLPCNCYVAVGMKNGCLEVWKISNKRYDVYTVPSTVKIPCLTV
jgi:hypothetical protein